MAMDIMRNEDDPTTSYIHEIVGQTSIEGPVPLQVLLMRIYEKWHLISAKRKIDAEYPISFTEDEISKARRSGGGVGKGFQ